MGLFRQILEKLGIGDEAAQPSPTPRAPRHPVPSTTRATPGAARSAAPFAPPAPRAVTVVDVVSQLEKRAAASPQKLNWQTSIVDLMKLLDLDSSLSARKELATELGCPAALMEDSAKMNVWLHRTVLAKVAANGGNVPRDLLT